MKSKKGIMYRIFDSLPLPFLSCMYPFMLPRIEPRLVGLRERMLSEMDELVYGDGGRESPSEIFRKLFIYGLRYPRCIQDFRSDYTFIELFKMRYFQMSFIDRVTEAHTKGIPVAARCFPPELAYAAGAIPVDILMWFNEAAWSGNFESTQKGWELTSFECCPGECAMAAMIEAETFPVDLVVSGSGTIFGDAPWAHVLHRSGRGVPVIFIDWPHSSHVKPWGIKYLADQFRNAVKRISEISGKMVKDEDLMEIISRTNEVRRLYREFAELCLSAPIPPVASLEALIACAATIEWAGDPAGVASVMKSVNGELRKRIENGISPPGVSRNPVRLFGVGRAAIQPVYGLIDDFGGVIHGYEIFWTPFAFDVDEAGDPYEALAVWCLERWPYSPSISIERRIDWLIEIFKRGNIEGTIIFDIWGCNWDPPLSRLLADTIREKAGIPSLILTTCLPERDANGSYKVSGQVRTRIEAFMEILRLRKIN